MRYTNNRRLCSAFSKVDETNSHRTITVYFGELKLELGEPHFAVLVSLTRRRVEWILRVRLSIPRLRDFFANNLNPQTGELLQLAGKPSTT